jgi:hypothetical protein
LLPAGAVEPGAALHSSAAWANFALADNAAAADTITKSADTTGLGTQPRPYPHPEVKKLTIK